MFVAMLATPFVLTVQAKPATPVSGTIELVGAIPLSQTPKGGSDNQVWIMDLTEDWEGGITGISTTEAVWMMHRISSDLYITVHEKLTFENVMVLGKSGGLILEVNIEAPKGHWTIIGGTGELTNLRGHGTLTLATAPYSYTGQVHFDP